MLRHNNQNRVNSFTNIFLAISLVSMAQIAQATISEYCLPRNYQNVIGSIRLQTYDMVFDVDFRKNLFVMGGKAKLMSRRNLKPEGELGQVDLSLLEESDLIDESELVNAEERRELGITGGDDFGWVYVWNDAKCAPIYYLGFNNLQNGIKAVHSREEP